MPRLVILNTEYQEYLEDLRARAKAARLWANISSLAGFGAIPLTIIFIILDKQSIALASLCWFAGHFIGYLAKCAQQEMVDAGQRAEIAESVIKAAKQSSEQSHYKGNFQNKIGLN